MNKKTLITLAVVLGSILLVAGGVAFAYFMVTVGGTGNEENNTSTATTIVLGSIYYNGETTFTSNEMYPGMIGIQEFKIGPEGTTGSGVYEIDLESILPSEFGDDIEISLYKTTDTANNNVSVTTGNLTTTGQVAQEDSLKITGTPELVYGPMSLINSSRIALEGVKFDVSNFQETTYYLVYDYKNDGNQDSQMGKIFTGKVTVRLLTGDNTLGEICLNQNAAECIEKYALTYAPSTTNNDDPDNNVRYMGAQPANYVEFNDELWRIIGVFDVANSEKNYNNGVTEKRIKLIRNESIGNYSWDSSDVTLNNGNGVNQWGPSAYENGTEYLGADIMQTLNSTYLTSGAGACYGGSNLSKRDCIFGLGEDKINPLNSSAQELFERAVWNTGTFSTTSITYLTEDIYNAERSNGNGKLCSGSSSYCNDKIIRTSIWYGLVGLINMSDYGYATGGGTVDRNLCLTTQLTYWSTYYSSCVSTNWLKPLTGINWTMTVVPSTTAYNIFIINPNATGMSSIINNSPADRGILPTVYLKHDIIITSGTGTSENPYQISL